MKPYDINIVTFEAMFVCYLDAFNRYGVAMRESDPIRSYGSLVEALNWAVSLDDRADAHLVTGRTPPVKYGWRNHVANAELMAGVRLVRNSAHHDWSDVFELSPRRDPSSSRIVWTWGPADDLPPPREKPFPANEAVYRQQIEGRPVGWTLDVLSDVFLTLQHMLEPHTILATANPFDDYPFPAMKAGVTP